MDDNLSKLTDYAKLAYRNSMDLSKEPRERAEVTAITVGRQAKRLGITQEEVGRWLQSAYGTVWVVGGSLNPGMDLKEIRKIVLREMGK